ncbi:HAD-IIA family hydrolase [Hoyosella altamirensis]|uniref:HAD superfamily hydrolase (TIGR01450 family) n=1 Tax=Hoyosella altamirensis TaxID=616997 RepID=A0A839RQ56_9ACTN|nr:HAD-IIA family hydrolase [Hoyosella altamirensis]MBB3038670.1 HAD superfamily hydrolase (TIGR01450 family) [Hoyosella altamirensis]
MARLFEEFDGLLLDLDGTLYRGPQVVPHAVDVLHHVGSTRLLYVTNNASRSASDVAEHLVELGFAAACEDVITSAQSAARLVSSLVPPGSKVLVVGTEAFADEIRKANLVPVTRFDEGPDAVVQGHSPDTGWALLAEAALAIRSGAVWVAANLDATLPTERGLLPGNGSMVAAVRTATDAEPYVAGKPGDQIFKDAIERASLSTPLVVGDRLDTDIAGARAAGLPSFYVMTGVSQPLDVLRAGPDMRPDYIAADLRGLGEPAEQLRPGPQEGWDVFWDGPNVVITATDSANADGAAALRAVASTLWSVTAPETATRILVRGARAAQLLRAWSVDSGVSHGGGGALSVSVEADD